MSNRDVFKELYSKYLNKEKNYNQILETIERENKGMDKYLKWAFVPICFVAVICGVMVFGGNKSSLSSKKNDKPSVDEENRVVLNINHINEEMGINKIDARIEEISNYYNIPYYEVLSNLEIPKDFDGKEYMNAVFTKSNSKDSDYDCLTGDSKDSDYDCLTKSEYDYLLQYEKIYQNSSNDRNIVIRYSEKNKPVRDYHFEGGKVSKINDFDCIIYQYEDSYMTEFRYKDLNIDIETTNITEEELVRLLQSIIQ